MPNPFVILKCYRFISILTDQPGSELGKLEAFYKLLFVMYLPQNVESHGSYKMFFI